MIHNSFQSLLIAINILNKIISIYFYLWYKVSFMDFGLGILWIYIFIINWKTDLLIESFFNIIIHEQLSMLNYYTELNNDNLKSTVYN